MVNVYFTENESVKLQQAQIQGNLATEIGLIVLDCVGLYSIHFRESITMSEGDNPIMRKLFDIYLSFIQLGQSELLFRHVFAALRAYINNFSFVLFKGNIKILYIVLFLFIIWFH